MIPIFPRSREITDAFGARLRIGVERHPLGPLVTLEHPDRRGQPRALLDSYGTEILAGFIMAARLALPGTMPDEHAAGTFPLRLRLARVPGIAIILTQAELERPFLIAATFWDRLYAELCLVGAHARQLSRRVDMSVH